MKVFREFEVGVASSSREEFLSRIEQSLPEGWRRNREAEEHSHRLGEDTPFRYFTCDEAKGRRAALVAFATRDSLSMYVPNIVPRERGRLTYDEYNAILTEFMKFVLPVANEMGLSTKTTKDQQTLEDWISPACAEKLRRFSAAANKSTGSSHPYDEERWFDFIVEVVNSGDPLDGSRVGRWLVEEGKWTDEIAHGLVCEFEKGVALLEYYRKTSG